MIRALATEEIERVLRAEVVGRLGCHADGHTYVVPVCYAYQDGTIYAHSNFGQKIDMLRQNPSVCFEVDHVEDLANWNSAICWGTYEELTGPAAEAALALLRERLQQRLPRAMEHGRLAAEEADGGANPIVFCIRVAETSGREERLHWELLPSVTREPSTAAEVWLSHARAQQFADLAGVLDAADVWEAADRLSARHPSQEVVASLQYQGVEADMAARIVGVMLELRDHARVPAAVNPLSPSGT